MADRIRWGFFANWRQNIIYIGFVVIFVVFAVTLADKGFLNPTNLLNIIRQTAMIAVMAVAMTFVLAAGEIDLSIGAVAGLATVTVAMAIAVAGPLAGVLAGHRHRLRGGLFQRLADHTHWHPILSDHAGHDGHRQGRRHVDFRHRRRADPVARLFLGVWRRLPRPGPGSAVLDAGGGCRRPFRRCAAPGFGRRVLATGGGETAARYSGIDTANIKFKVLVLSSTAAALAGMLYAGRLQSGRFQLGEGDELSVIAAAVLGGTSLFGGKGTVIGTIVGALMIGLINNGLILMGLEFSQQLIARGAIIILAVALSQKRA